MDPANPVPSYVDMTAFKVPLPLAKPGAAEGAGPADGAGLGTVLDMPVQVSPREFSTENTNDLS